MYSASVLNHGLRLVLRLASRLRHPVNSTFDGMTGHNTCTLPK